MNAVNLDFEHAIAKSGHAAAPLGIYYGKLHRLSRRSRRRIPNRITQDIENQLEVVNGQRQTRLLYLAHVRWCIRKVIESETDPAVEFIHGGHVANAYKYPAVATACLALRVGRVVAIQIKEVNARKGCTGFGSIKRYSAKSNGAQEIRDQFIRENADFILELY